MRRSHYLTFAACAFLIPMAGADVVLVANGQAQAVIVTPDKPLPVALYAAQELQLHVAKASGAQLPIVAESQAPKDGGRVFVGRCSATRVAVPNVDTLAPEQSVIKTLGRDLYLVGGDGNGRALAENTPAGTLFAVYELLDTRLGVRWLWPGDVGLVVPKTNRIVIPDTDRTFAPKFFQRKIRNGLNPRRTPVPEGLSKEAYKQYSLDVRTWLRRQRMGRNKALRWGHSFNKYWERFGKTHPEYFQLVGRRGPSSHYARFSMCVSNTELHALIVHEWRRRGGNINLCENDINGMCACRECRALDGPGVRAITKRYAQRCVSDRYARFWQRVLRLASTFDPDVICTAYAYVNYAPPPQTDVQLGEHMIVGLVPDIFFPRTPTQHQWVLDQWAGWARTGAKLFLRPNYFLGGYCMPQIFVHQFAQEYEHAIANHMAATDFDSLTGMFGVQGPNLYYMTRKLTRTDLSVDEILGEYYAGFGAAAEQVKEYFDYWERYVMDNRERFQRIGKERGANWANYPRMAHLLYPPEVFAPARKHLDAALAAAAGDAEALARVEFLVKGMEHAEKCVAYCAAMASAAAGGEPASPYETYQDLLQFRAATQRDNIINVKFCAYLEGRAYGSGKARPVRYTGEPLRPVVERPDMAAPIEAIPVRKPHGFIALLKAGEHFAAEVQCKRVGRYDQPCTWLLFGPDRRLLAKGVVAIGQAHKIDAPAAKAGVYNLVVDAGRNVSAVKLLNAHAALLGNAGDFLGRSGPLFVYVPKGKKKFSILLRTAAPGETATLIVRDPDGKEVAKGSTGKAAEFVARVTVPAQHRGRAYRIEISPAPPGVLEDWRLSLNGSLPPYWASAPDRLVAPAPK